VDLRAAGRGPSTRRLHLSRKCQIHLVPAECVVRRRDTHVLEVIADPLLRSVLRHIGNHPNGTEDTTAAHDANDTLLPNAAARLPSQMGSPSKEAQDSLALAVEV
jgi:dGTP triphosphohydrolase